MTPSSYPQGQAPIVNNPAFWERLGADNFGTDTLFFSFYYQQVVNLLLKYNKYGTTIFSCLFLILPMLTEYLSAISGCKRVEKTIMEIP